MSDTHLKEVAAYSSPDVSEPEQVLDQPPGHRSFVSFVLQFKQLQRTDRRNDTSSWSHRAVDDSEGSIQCRMSTCIQIYVQIVCLLSIPLITMTPYCARIFMAKKTGLMILYITHVFDQMNDQLY